MRYLIVIIAFFLFSCQAQTIYPEGGFDYPINVSNEDTNHYFYQLKDIVPLNEGLLYHSAYRALIPFYEPNLSTKPQPKETFRLFYSEAFGECVILTLTVDHIIIKKGDPTEAFSEDTSQLSPIEIFHLKFLQRRLHDYTDRSPYIKKNYDSIIKLYPQLQDPNYYYKLYDKSMVRSHEKFNYTTSKINLTKKQYNSLIQEINSSGFWSLPYKVECEAQPMDGFGFTLEANTKKKYKVVSVGACEENNAPRFTKACQQLIKFSNLEKEINLNF